MYWEKCKVHYFKTSSAEFAKIEGPDVTTGRPYWVYIPKKDFDALASGTPINVALKGHPLSIKEFLVAGFASSQESAFVFKRLPIRKAYITNAVANSVAFYACTYLNGQGFSISEIKNLREKFSLENISKNSFTISELRASFENQSVAFLNLYQEMNAGERFEQFVDSLKQDRFRSLFSKYDDASALKSTYRRKVFHDKLECEFMRQDYTESAFHSNTGVFAESTAIRHQLYYGLDKQYLEALGMRQCKGCFIS